MSDTNDYSLSIAHAKSMADIQKESQFPVLNGRGFVRAETAEDQWLLFVSEAWEKSKLPENLTIVIYLSKMLNHYMTDEELYKRLAAFSYAGHFLKAEDVDVDLVKDVADISLQYVAFVPGRNNHRNEPRSLEYSAKLGESFYRHLALTTSNKDSFNSRAYEELSKSFGLAVMVLRSACAPFKNIVAKANEVCFPDNMMASEVVNQYLFTTKVSSAVN